MAHLHHPHADSSVEFKGVGAHEKGGDVKPVSYNPPKLTDEFCEVEITCCGICGSDLMTIDCSWGPTTFPQIVGHEIVGHITAVGSKVTNVKVGDRVGIGAQCGACHNVNKDCHECASGHENHCSKKLIWTFGSKYPDGQISQGGYADRVRCDAKFAFKLPESISSQEAAPLMCAGITVYAPLARYMTRKNMTVAILGIGGLGHLGLMFASKLQGGSAEVWAVSHNSKKKEEALKLGAKHYLDTSDKEQLKACARKFDVVICTANGSNMDIATWLTTVKLHGTFCTVGLPPEDLKFNAFALVGAEIAFSASGIGSLKEIEDMLAFCDKHNIRPIIEKIPMDKANEGIKRVRDGSVRFRVVLENPGKK